MTIHIQLSVTSPEPWPGADRRDASFRGGGERVVDGPSAERCRHGRLESHYTVALRCACRSALQFRWLQFGPRLSMKEVCETHEEARRPASDRMLERYD